MWVARGSLIHRDLWSRRVAIPAAKHVESRSGHPGARPLLPTQPTPPGEGPGERFLGRVCRGIPVTREGESGVEDAVELGGIEILEPQLVHLRPGHCICRRSHLTDTSLERPGRFTWDL